MSIIDPKYLENLPRVVPDEPTHVLDLRVTGSLTKDDTHFLTTWLSKQDSERKQLALQAKEDFGWTAQNLAAWTEGGYVPTKYHRPDAECVSGGEWLNGVLSSGSSLDKDHVRILMYMVNAKSGDKPDAKVYISGKALWTECAPPAIRKLLDCLDDAAVAYQDVKVIDPDDDEQAALSLFLS